MWSKKIPSEVKGDIVSCFNRVSYLINFSPQKDKLIFFTVSIAILLVLIFTSTSEANFYFNLFNILLILVATFIVLCLSDTFWFLIKKAQVYKFHVKNKKSINKLLKELNARESLDKKKTVENIDNIVDYYNHEYKYHAIRNAIEISIVLLLLLFTFPTFFIFNFALFIGMFVYVFLYEQQSVNQAFDDISALTCLIDSFYKANPKVCKKLIIENNRQGIKDLRTIYNIVSRV